MRHPSLERKLWGITFPNPIGLAAGFDKNAEAVDALSALGFGFVEIGTVTPLAQPGNPLPRLFRLPADRGLINRMGFNNDGAASAAARLARRRKGIVVGGNIGKNKQTPNEMAAEDYLKSFEALYPVVDYFVINVSSPNTPGLRGLQEKEPLMDLLSRVRSRSQEMPVYRPVLLKIAPDLSEDQLADIIDVMKSTGIDGVIATNTTISRDHLKTPAELVSAIGAGGLSGAPLVSRSTEVIRTLRKGLGPSFPIIGVGGIFSPEDAIEKMKAGADLVQVYTGFIYEGPSLARRICKALTSSTL